MEVSFAYSTMLMVKQLVIGRDMMCIFAALVEDNTFSDPSVTFCSCLSVVGMSLNLPLQYALFINNPSAVC